MEVEYARHGNDILNYVITKHELSVYTYGIQILFYGLARVLQLSSKSFQYLVCV